MSTTTYFLWKNKKNIMQIPPLIWRRVERTRKHLRLAKTGLNSGVVLFSSGLEPNFYCIVVTRFVFCFLVIFTDLE